MRPSTHLDTLADTAAKRVLSLRAIAKEHQPNTPGSWSAEDQRAVSYVLVEAANLWEGYCRAFFLSTALRARDASGVRVSITFPTPIQSLDDALTVAVHRMSPRTRNRSGPWLPRDEPDWCNTGHLRPLLRHIGASNLQEIDTALGLVPSARDDLRRTRNYFAHKSLRSANSIRSLQRDYGITRVVHPMTFLFSVAPQRPGISPTEPVVLRWLDVLYRTIRLTVPAAL